MSRQSDETGDGPDRTALDQRAKAELALNIRRGKVLLVVSSLVLVLAFAVPPAFGSNPFDRLLGVIAFDTVTIATCVGSLFRARTERGILMQSTWRHHRCSYEPPGWARYPYVVVHGRGTYALRIGLIWRIASGGLSRTSHVDVAYGPGEEAVLRVPHHEKLFLALKPIIPAAGNER